MLEFDEAGVEKICEFYANPWDREFVAYMVEKGVGDDTRLQSDPVLFPLYVISESRAGRGVNALKKGLSYISKKKRTVGIMSATSFAQFHVGMIEGDLGDEAERKRALTKAISMAKYVLKTDPDNALARAVWIQSLFELKKFKECAEVAKQCARDDAELGVAFYFRAAGLAFEGLWDEGIKASQVCLKKEEIPVGRSTGILSLCYAGKAGDMLYPDSGNSGPSVDKELARLKLKRDRIMRSRNSIEKRQLPRVESQIRQLTARQAQAGQRKPAMSLNTPAVVELVEAALKYARVSEANGDPLGPMCIDLLQSLGYRIQAPPQTQQRRR